MEAIGMRRRTLIVALGISTACTALLAAAFGAYALWRGSDPAFPTDLAAPLPVETAADFAAAQPVIDELRHLRGSVLDGTSLDGPPEAGSPPDNSYVELLRREARRLDSLAADCEDQGDYDRADDARREAESLWRLAREQAEAGRPTFSLGTFNR
jgi:hypothetical protein